VDTLLREGGTLEDDRIWNVRDEKLHYQLPRFKDREEWLDRARYLRQHILICCGLWPTPERTPLNPRIFGRIEQDDYAVEKVYFESYPGFFVTGNLYTPLNGSPPFPGVLCPHGHWKYGRLEDSDRGSVPGRCINFAKQGHVAFSYDMVGYVDNFQIGHDFGSREGDALWGINLAGLQLWNSMRSIDFLQSLDKVDPKRIGCTGASGGGTQTFLLTAVDERISVAAPVCMVSAHYQGGCLCENPPNLRVETFNVEIAALAAPRPLLLVSATGDWTRDTPACEYPAIKRIYSLFNAEDRVKYAHFDAGHNYNKASREAVYAWFGKWLLGKEDEALFREKPFKVESHPKLLVFYGIPLPETQINPDTLRRRLISKATDILGDLKPKDFEGLKRFRDIIGAVYKHSLLSSQPKKGETEISVLDQLKIDEAQVRRLTLSRKGVGDGVPALEVETFDGEPVAGTLIIHEKGKGALLGLERGEVKSLVKELISLGQRVLLVDCFATSEYLKVEGILERGKNVRFFTTYNRTVTAERVQDILTGIAYLSDVTASGKINLIGLGEAGLWCLLARGLAEGVESMVVDVNGFNQDDEEEWLQRLFAPLMRRAGGLDTAIALTVPSRLFMHNTKEGFKPDFASKLYEALDASENLKVKRDEATETEIIKWIM